jgi:ankyrin repeat protein
MHKLPTRSSEISIFRRRLAFVLPVVGIVLAMPTMVRAGSYDDYFRAVKFDDDKAVKDLLAKGFWPNTVEPARGENGLIIALRENSMKVFNVLLNAPNIDLEEKAYNGDTVLMIAAYKGNKQAVEALLAKGAEVNRPGWTALHYAAAAGNDDIVSMLLEKSAYIDAESPNKTTPIMMAAQAGNIYTVKLLLDEGADATLKNEAGMTAIDIAKQSDHMDIAEGLTYQLKKVGKLP